MMVWEKKRSLRGVAKIAFMVVKSPWTLKNSNSDEYYYIINYNNYKFNYVLELTIVIKDRTSYLENTNIS